MTIALALALFFGGFAAGSLHSARQDYRWRNATVVRGMLVKNGTQLHYEYHPPGKPVVTGSAFRDDSVSQPDGIVDDWVRLEYDAGLAEPLRRHLSKGRADSNYAQFRIELIAGSIFALVCAGCLFAFGRAWYDKRHLAESF